MDNWLAKLWRSPEVREKLLFTAFILLVYRIGAHVTVPGIDVVALRLQFGQYQNTLFGIYDMFVGGGLSRATVFALGIMPYISASIIFQLTAAVFPAVEKMQKEGEDGRKRLTQWTRYATVGVAIMQAYGYAAFLQGMGGGAVRNPGFGFVFTTVIALTVGAMFVMWLGEQITERGIGNGMSLLIFAGIVGQLPNAILLTFGQMASGEIGLIRVAFLLVMAIAVVAAIVFVERAHRRITVQ